MHRVIIEDKDQELLYKIKGFLRKPGQKPVLYSEAVVGALKIAEKYFHKVRIGKIKPFQGI